MTTGQLGTVLWLRWRLSSNQYRRQGIVAQILAGVALFLLATLVPGAAIGGGFLGYFGLAKGEPREVLLFWDVIVAVFLIVWVIGVLSELQRSEVFDLTRLLHLPVSPRGLFFLNYAMSHATPSVLVAVPALGGIACGLAIARGPSHLLLVPLGLAGLFMITAWTYCLRGWLAALMVNPRRRRSIILGITTGFILLVQVPNFFILTGKHRQRPPAEQPAATPVRGSRGLPAPPEAWLAVHGAVPLLWLPLGAHALAESNPWPATASAAGAALIGILGLRRAYRSTLLFYRGGVTSDPVRPVPAAPVARPATRSRIWRIPGLRDPVQSVTEATLRTLVRAPEVRLTLVSTLAMSGVFLFMLLVNRRDEMPGKVHGLVILGAGLLSLITLGQLFCNQFGLDRDGFRTLVLSPMARSDILLGKNLALGLLAFAVGAASISMVRCLLTVPAQIVLAGLLQCAASAILMGLCGNLASVLMPYRMATGTLKKAATPLGVTLGIAVLHMTLPLFLLPAALPTLAGFLWRRSGGSGAWPVELVTAAVVLAACIALYRLCLPALGDLFEQRQLRILETITRTAE